MTVNELKALNNLTSDSLSIGQTLKVISEETLEENTYTVKKGDSLYSIAKAYGTTVDELKRLNNKTSNLLSIGEVLIVPTSTTEYYTVEKGDTLYSIAKIYNTTVDAIKKANNLTSNTLTIGSKLIIP